MDTNRLLSCIAAALALFAFCANAESGAATRQQAAPPDVAADADGPAAVAPLPANSARDALQFVPPAPSPSNTPATTVEMVTERYPNGNIKIERQVTKDADGNYVNHGSYTVYDIDGKVQKTGQFLFGKQQGLWTQTFAKDDNHLFSADRDMTFAAPFVSEAAFVDGHMHGAWTIKSSDAKPIIEWSFDHGARDGKWTWWYPNGQKRIEAAYRNGNLDGDVMEWNPDGKLIAKNNYIDGKHLVRIVGWYTLGQKRFEGCYLRTSDIPQATYDWWKGTVVTVPVIPVARDLKHGVWTEWYLNGNKKLVAEYDHDVPIGKFTWWYDNGQKQAEIHYQAGVLDGLWTTWHPNGLKESQAEHRNGELVDKWLHWNSDGKLVEVRDPAQSASGIAKGNRPAPQPTIVPTGQSR